MMAMRRMSALASGASKLSPEARQLGEHIAQYKEESEKEDVNEVCQLSCFSEILITQRGNVTSLCVTQDRAVMHFDGEHSSNGSGHTSPSGAPLETKVAELSIDKDPSA